jgi:hypothetical protein
MSEPCLKSSESKGKSIDAADSPGFGGSEFEPVERPPDPLQLVVAGGESNVSMMNLTLETAQLDAPREESSSILF